MARMLEAALARIRSIGARFNDAGNLSRAAGRSSLDARTTEGHAKAAQAHAKAARSALTERDREHHSQQARKHAAEAKKGEDIMARMRARHAEGVEPAKYSKTAPRPAHAEAKKAEPEQRDWKQGRKGGRYYIGHGGKKIYEQKRWRGQK
jgi:hypothetical protein